MNKNKHMEKLREEIERKRSRLNHLVEDNLRSEETLIVSQELDLLINEYCRLKDMEYGKK